VTGTLLSQRRYLPYGETRPDFAAGPFPTDRRFTGQREEVTLGLYDYGARFYSPSLGRFISADSIVPEPNQPQSLNRYMYTLGNPLRYTDPSGHIVVLATAALGGLIGGGVSIISQAAPVLVKGGTIQDAYQAVDPVKVIGATAGGAIFGLTMGFGTALLGTGLVATAVSGAAAGAIGGQASIGTEAVAQEVLQNPLNSSAWDKTRIAQTARANGWGDWRTITIDAGSGAAAGVIGRGANQLAENMGLIPKPPSGLGRVTSDTAFNIRGVPIQVSDANIEQAVPWTTKLATTAWTVIRGAVETVSCTKTQQLFRAVAQ